MAERRQIHLPIRLRLTLWYVLLMGVTFTVFALFLSARFQSSLLHTLDTSLQIAVSQTISTFEVEEDLIELGRLTFGDPRENPSDGFAMRIVSVDKQVWDVYGQASVAWSDLEAGYANRLEWRILSQPVSDQIGTTVAWVQAAQSTENISETLDEFQSQLFWGIPLLLAFAGLGGYFLAGRALNPIARITAAARSIGEQDLSRRIEYDGPADELSSLAHTLDAMLARLEAAFIRERQFTSDAAHELRTPLTILKGQMEVTLNRRRTAVEYKQNIQELLKQVDRLVRMTNALLFLSRSDHQQLGTGFSTCNLSELLTALAEQVRPLAENSQLDLKTDIPGDLKVHGDRDHLAQLFLNLLDNAVKYTPAGGEILFAAVREQGGIRIRVRNTGAHIEAGHLPHLFDRFYRVDGARSHATGGAGLGLAIAREIARLHGGEIQADSDPQKGVIFTVTLPAGQDQRRSLGFSQKTRLE